MKLTVRLISCICIAACLADLLILYTLGKQFPGYNHATDTLSRLGASVSPVSSTVSAWWVILGIVFIIFGIGFAIRYRRKGKPSLIAAILLALYGLGEGMGSGLFKADHVGGSLTVSAIIHNVVGGFGLAAVLVLPMVIRRLFPKDKHRAFYIFSTVIFYVGIVSTLLFLTRYTGDNILSHYKGIWQRVTLVNTYVYFVVLAIMMIMEELPLPTGSSKPDLP